jgi:hypothetical protein
MPLPYANALFPFDTAEKAELVKYVGVVAGADIDTLQAQVAALTTYAENLNTWAIALATKLNLDAGVTDANYDANPQA